MGQFMINIRREAISTQSRPARRLRSKHYIPRASIETEHWIRPSISVQFSLEFMTNVIQSLFFLAVNVSLDLLDEQKYKIRSNIPSDLCLESDIGRAQNR